MNLEACFQAATGREAAFWWGWLPKDKERGEQEAHGNREEITGNDPHWGPCSKGSKEQENKLKNGTEQGREAFGRQSWSTSPSVSLLCALTGEQRNSPCRQPPNS